eukprot:gene4832-8679_t
MNPKFSEQHLFKTLLFLYGTLVAIWIPGAFGAKGVDVSQRTYINAWKCLKSDGYKFAIIRCFQSSGHPDPNCPHTIYNAWDGGMDHVDIYFFPDPRAGNAAEQMDAMVSNLDKNNIKPRSKKPGTYGMLWLDIEGPQYWTSSKSENRNFFTELAKRAKHHGIAVGVYTSASQWGPIMGEWSGGSGYPLWYAHYDGSASFSDFKPFGGAEMNLTVSVKPHPKCNACGVKISWFTSSTLPNPALVILPLSL